MNKSDNDQKGFPIFRILTIIFVIAKITGFINWSWWLVFLPSLIPLAIGLVILLGLIVAAYLDS